MARFTTFYVLLLLSLCCMVFGMVQITNVLEDFEDVAEAEIQSVLDLSAESEPCPLFERPAVRAASEDSNSTMPEWKSYLITFRLQASSSQITALFALISRCRNCTLAGSWGESEEGMEFRGFAAKLPPAMVDLLRRSSLIEFIESDDKIQFIKPNEDVEAKAADNVDAAATVTWNLDRIDQPSLPLNGRYNGRISNAKASVHAYVIDTGLKAEHSEFTGRAVYNYDYYGQGGVDRNGHGTHVGGIIGSVNYGVAGARVTLHAVRVLDANGSGSVSTVVAGINWVIKNVQKPAVAVMSLSVDGSSPSLDLAIKSAKSAGITVVVAAGNDGQNACLKSPARSTDAISVGSTTSTDQRSSFSNWGTCVTLFAPGSSILSTYIGAGNPIAYLSGTSMAAPHVAGLAAVYLYQNPKATPDQVRSALLASASRSQLRGVQTGSPNLLAQLNANWMTARASNVMDNRYEEPKMHNSASSVTAGVYLGVMAFAFAVQLLF